MPPPAHGSQGEISKIDALLTPRKLALGIGCLKAGTDLWDRFERSIRQIMAKQHNLAIPCILKRDILSLSCKYDLFPKNGLYRFFILKP
jgi:hypothetical protein